METGTEIQSFDAMVSSALAQYTVTDAAIGELRARCSGLKIAGVEDKRGYALVHEARMGIVGLRSAVEKTRKDLKRDALEYGRKVEAEANRIKSALEEIELPLETAERAIDAERKRLADEAEAARRAVIHERTSQLVALGVIPALGDIEAASAEQFLAMVDAARQAKAAKDEAERAEQAAAKAIADAEAEARKVEAAARAEEKRIADAKAAEERAAEVKRLKDLEAENERIRVQNATLLEERRQRDAEQAKRDSEARAEASRLKAQQDAEREAAERAARAPEIERIKAFASELLALEIPEVACRGQIEAIVNEAALRIEGLAR